LLKAKVTAEVQPTVVTTKIQIIKSVAGSISMKLRATVSGFTEVKITGIQGLISGTPLN